MATQTEELDVADVEECAKHKRPLPPARRYRIKIDGKHYVVEKRKLTGGEILALAGKTPPERFQLDKRLRGGKFVPVGNAEVVDLGEPGLEVFECFPLDEREG